MASAIDNPEECALVVHPDGHIVGMYSDNVPWAEIGRITAMPRASRVEWDVTTQEWVARDARTGTVVARGRSRQAVLRDEHAHYVQALLATSRAIPETCLP